MEFLQAHVCFITEDVQREAFERLLRKVESRIPVSPEEILLVRDSFTFKPFCLTAINPKHVVSHDYILSIFFYVARS